MPGALILCSVFLVSFLATARATAQEDATTTRITIVGTIEPSLRLVTLGDSVRIEGQLKDDQDLPLAGQVTLQGHEERAFQPCAGMPMDLPFSSRQRTFSTDADGSFCLTSSGSPLDSIRLLAQATDHKTGSFVLTPSPRSSLRPRIVRAPANLVRGSSHLSVVEVLQLSTEISGPITTVLRLNCSGAEQLLGEESSTGGQLTRFEFTGEHVSALGACSLVVSAHSDSSSAWDRSPDGEARQTVLVQAVTELTLQSLTNKSHDTVAAEVVASVTSPREEVVTGTLEARSDDSYLASCTLENNRCTLSLERANNARQVTIALVPGDDVWLVGRSLSVTVPKREPSPWPAILEMLALTAFSVWLARLWLGRKEPTRPDSRIPHGHAGVTQTGTTRKQLHGTVIDTHTGAAIAGAFVDAFEVTPTTERLVEGVQTDATGKFLSQIHPTTDTLLRVRIRAEGYVPVEAIVVGSQLGVQLTQIRRALLSNLLAWASARGIPLRPRIPGPVEIASYAENSASDEEATWAKNTAKAAYGPQTPTESALASLSERQRR